MFAGTENLGGSDHIGFWASNVLIIEKAPDGSGAGGVTIAGANVPTHFLGVTKSDGENKRVPLTFIGEQMRFEGVAGGSVPFETPPPVSPSEGAARAAYADLSGW